MIVIGIVRRLLALYALLEGVYFALPYLTKQQQSWMSYLARICEPGARIGNLVAAKVLPGRQFKSDIGPLCALCLCVICQILLGLIFFAL